MPQFLFDTDHLTLFQHKHPAVMANIAAQPVGAVAARRLVGLTFLLYRPETSGYHF